MTDRKTLIRLALAACIALFAVSCSGGDDAGQGLEDAVEDVKQAGEELADAVDEAGEAAGDAMVSTIDEIKAAIEEKEGELEAVKARLAELSPAEMTGETGSTLKRQSEALAAELAELKEKLEDAMAH